MSYFSFDRRFSNVVNLQYPSQIGHFSVNDGCFISNDSEKRFLVLPSKFDDLNWDLNAGYETAVQIGMTETRRFDFLLQWVLQEKSHVKSLIRKSKEPLLLFNRGSLKAVMNSSGTRDDWMVCATKYKGAIFMASYSAEKHLEERANAYQKLLYYYGSKFESFLTAKTEFGKPEPNSTLNQLDQYYLVLSNQLGNHLLLYSAEVDAFDTSQPLTHWPNERYVELKTTSMPPREKSCPVNPRRLLHAYNQCRLTGVKYLYYGFRNKDGFVKKIEKFQVQDMPRMSDYCFYQALVDGCGNQFLDNVKRILKYKPEKTVLKFTFTPTWSGRVKYEKYEPPQDQVVLPDWFTTKF